MRSTIVLWAALAALFVGFRLWYDGGRDPLTSEEVARAVATLTERGADPSQIEKLRAFIAADRGGDFVMANFIHFRETPLAVGGIEPGESSQAALDRYMAHMWPALLRRACHPVLGGPVVGAALDRWGIEGGDRWSMVGLVRYRSRRDVLEIVLDPAFRDAHLYKNAAMEQTIAIPVEPFLQLGNPRWIVGLVLVTVGAFGQLALARWTPER